MYKDFIEFQERVDESVARFTVLLDEAPPSDAKQ